MSAYIQTINGNYIEHIDTYIQNQYNAPEQQVKQPHSEDVQPIDTSFFCTNRFTVDIIEKNIRDVIEKARSKADACRNIMDLEKFGYILLSNQTDADKAKLINPFAAPTYTFTAEDFKKARNSSHSFPGK